MGARGASGRSERGREYLRYQLVQVLEDFLLLVFQEQDERLRAGGYDLEVCVRDVVNVQLDDFVDHCLAQDFFLALFLQLPVNELLDLLEGQLTHRPLCVVSVLYQINQVILPPACVSRVAYLLLRLLRLQ